MRRIDCLGPIRGDTGGRGRRQKARAERAVRRRVCTRERRPGRRHRAGRRSGPGAGVHPPQYEGVPERVSRERGVAMVVIQGIPNRSPARPATGATESATSSAGRSALQSWSSSATNGRQQPEVLAKLATGQRITCARAWLCWRWLPSAPSPMERSATGRMPLPSMIGSLRAPYEINLERIARGPRQGEQRVEVSGKWRRHEREPHYGASRGASRALPCPRAAAEPRVRAHRANSSNPGGRCCSPLPDPRDRAGGSRDRADPEERRSCRPGARPHEQGPGPMQPCGISGPSAPSASTTPMQEFVVRILPVTNVERFVFCIVAGNVGAIRDE